METTIIKQLSEKGMEAYFTARQFPAMYWATFFPLKNVNSLNITTLLAEQGGRIAADVIAYNASAPLKSISIPLIIISL